MSDKQMKESGCGGGVAQRRRKLMLSGLMLLKNTTPIWEVLIQQT
jgi:hypothetical protein